MSTSPVTLMVARRVAKGRYEELMAWLREGEQLATDFPGYLGSGVLAPPPNDDEFQIIFRFADEKTLHAWEFSASRGAWLSRGSDLFATVYGASMAGLAQRAPVRHAGSRRWRSGWRFSRCRCSSTSSWDRCSVNSSWGHAYWSAHWHSRP
jgi:antibiotic biosynthesis monooxygenase (ABM) superfamily enzyme